MRNTHIVFVRFLLLFILSCGAPGADKVDDIQRGEISIIVDETLVEPIATGIFNFENINKNAKIQLMALPEQKAFQTFKSDTARLIVTTRELTEDELRYFEQIKVTPRYTPIGYDAVVMITSKQSDGKYLKLANFGSFLKGEISQWKDLFPASSNAERPIFVFSGSGAGTMTTLLEYFGIESTPAEVYALESPEAVMNYVAEKKNAIGVVGLSWYNGLGREKLIEFESKAQVLAVDNPESGLKGYFYPDQTSIADDTYPFKRKLIGISREARVGLGTGFISFMASERGQRIILKAGLVPYSMPSRELIIYDNEYQVKE